MRVLFWVQHLLGTGHLKRAATVARALVERGLEVTLVSGGPAAPWLVPAGVELVQLPAVRARDLAFSALVDAGDRPLDDTLRAARRAQLLALFAARAPQIVITEMFPFGRRAFRFELLPLLDALAVTRPRPWLVCSVRDILVRKAAAEGYAWMRDLALARYDRVLVHTDPALIPFGLTFPHADALGSRLVSTGYVVEPGPEASRGDEVLVSAGGGRVGQRLLEAAMAAHPLSRQRGHPWRLIAGGEVEPAGLDRLRAELTARYGHGAPARRFPGAVGEVPSLGLAGRLQHGGGGATARQADGSGPVRDGYRDRTTDPGGAADQPWARRDRLGGGFGAKQPGPGDRPSRRAAA